MSGGGASRRPCRSSRSSTTPGRGPLKARHKVNTKLLDNRNVLGLLFMLPAAALLLVFLTYPLGLGT